MKAVQLVNDMLRDYAALRNLEYAGPDHDPTSVIRIYTRIPDDPQRSSNGGDYYYWTDYRQVGTSVYAEEGCSCDMRMDLRKHVYDHSTLAYACDIVLVEAMRNAWAEVSLDSVPDSGPWAEDDFVLNLARAVRSEWTS